VLTTTDTYRRVLKLLCLDLRFAEEFGDLLKSEGFFKQHHLIIFDQIQRFHFNYKREINHTDLRILIDEYCTIRSLDTIMLNSLRDELEEIFKIYTGDVMVLRDHLLTLIRRMRLSSSLKTAIDIVENNGNIDSIPQLMEKSIQLTLSDTGVTGESLEDLPILYQNLYGNTRLVPTGFPSLDDCLNGGYAPGELHVISGVPKTGKSTMGPVIGVNALLRGKRVFHITLEISEIEVMTKYSCILTGFGYDQIINSYNHATYLKLLSPYKPILNNLYIKYFTEGTASTSDIRSWISQVKNRDDQAPDFIIVDYDDCLVSSTKVKGDDSNDSLYGESGQIYSDLKILADYFKCPILTFSQVNRHGWSMVKKKGLITSDHLAHSARKAHRASSISSINFANGENEGVFYLDLARRGRSKQKIPIKRDLKKSLFWEEYNQSVNSFEELSD